jgi:phospholipase/lecithinase/hemolysin
VPGVGDTTIFDLDSTYDVTFSGNASSDRVFVHSYSGDTVTFLSSTSALRIYQVISGDARIDVYGDTTLNIGAANRPVWLNVGETMQIGNYGDGGSAISPGALGAPGMYQEIGYYLTTSGGVADPNALYFVWGGANDFLTLDSPILAAQNIAGYVGALAAAGAAHILVPNLPDLGYPPFAQSVGMEAQAQAFSVNFNTELAVQLGGLNLCWTDIIQFDTFSSTMWC